MPPLTDLDPADFLRLVDRRRTNNALLTYRPGTVLPGQSVSRTTVATYFDANGIAQQAPVNGLRDAHYIGGVRTTLLEGARTNSALWSRDLTNAAWVKTGTGTATQNAVGLGGTANSATTLVDSDAAAAYSAQQSSAVANDAAAHAVSFWVKKDTDQTRFVGLQLFLGGGTTTVSKVAHLNTQTGAITAESSPAGTTQRVVDGGLWWIVELIVTNNTTGNVTLAPNIYPARGTVAGTLNVAATGSCVVGQVQVELNSTFASSPIFTTTTAVNRAADLVTAGAGLAPLTPFTVLYKVIELGTGFVNSARYFQLGNNAAAASFNVKGTGVGAPMPELYNGGFVSVGGPVAHVLGDVLEIRATLDAAGGWSISQSINGAAETAQFTAAYGSFPGALAANLASMSIDGGGGTGFHALLSMKIERGVRSLAAMRSL